MRYEETQRSWEDTLRRLNLALLAEFPVPDDPVGGTDAQIFGLPRSGTTLLYQLLALTGSVAYPSNLMAMYHEVPWVGAKVQVQLARPGPTLSLASLAGRTREPLDPHEFGYFWRRVLRHTHNGLDRRGGAVAWSLLRRTLDAVHDVFEAPVVYKNFLVPAHADEMTVALPGMILLRVQRPLQEVAASLLAVRRRIGVPDEQDFGTTPSGWQSSHRSVFDRIASQVSLLSSDCEAVSGAQVRVIDYHEMCVNPRKVVGDVLNALDIPGRPSLEALPERLAPGSATSMLDDSDLSALMVALERVI